MPQGVSFDRPMKRTLPERTRSSAARNVSSIGVASASSPAFQPRDAKARGGAVGPVELVEVDIIGLQPSQAVFDSAHQIVAVKPGVSFAYPGEAARRSADRLARQYDFLPAAPAREPVADDLFGRSVALLDRRDRVHLRRIPEIDAALQRVVHLSMTFGLRVLPAPGHRAKANGADLHVCAAQSPVLHVIPCRIYQTYRKSVRTPV